MKTVAHSGLEMITLEMISKVIKNSTPFFASCLLICARDLNYCTVSVAEPLPKSLIIVVPL